MKTIPLSKVRQQLLKIAKEIEKKPDTVVDVSKYGKPLLKIISTELYESLLETLNILGDEETLQQLKKAIQEVKEGKTIPLDEALKELGLED